MVELQKDEVGGWWMVDGGWWMVDGGQEARARVKLPTSKLGAGSIVPVDNPSKIGSHLAGLQGCPGGQAWKMHVTWPTSRIHPSIRTCRW